MKKITAALMSLLIVCLFLVSAGCTENRSGATPPPEAVQAPLPQENFTPNETLVAFVGDAAAFVKDHGAKRALAEFNNPNGSFIRGELYIYAYGFNGTTLAHPVNPEAVGKTREGAIGDFVTQMGAVVRNGSGFYRFTYINPSHHRTLESKLGYGIKIDEDWWIGSGVYTGPVEAETATIPVPVPSGT
jgi:cytochrome c